MSASTRFGREILLLGFLLAACTERDPIFVGGMAAAETTVTETTPVDAAGAIAAVRDVQDSRDQSWSDAADAEGLAVDLSPTEPGAGDGDGTADSSGSANEVSPPDAAAPLDVQEVADATAFDGQVYDTPELPDAVVDAANADLPGDGGAADLAAACTLDAATWPGPPDTALLPGESTACAALGVAACVIVPSTKSTTWKADKTDDSWKSYVCFDAAGKAIVSAVQHPKANIDELSIKVPCSAAQVQKWLDAYQKPCWKLVPASAMPVSTFALLFDFAKIPQEVCSNVDGTRYRFTSGCAAYTYAIELDSPKYGPEPGELFVGYYSGPYGLSGALWTIWAKPPDVTAFQANNPIFACKNWSPGFMSMQPYGVGIADNEPELLGEVATKFWFSASYEKDIPKSLAAWSAVLAKLQVVFAKEPCKKM